ncbi:ROK family protein [Candidatus Gottesmanbacteria bacterium]|nr:ROK family protein [Candidatus Gottesmanbacteria bacterium]
MNIIFDIGGTNIRAGAFSNDGKLLAKRMVPALQAYKDGIERIALLTDELSPDGAPDKIAIVIAGVFDQPKQTILVSPNLSGWEGKPIVRDVSERLKAPVLLANDAVAAALGEARFGAGKRSRIVAFLTISTGIGGAKIVDGKLDANVWGFEPGNQIINMDEAQMVRNFGRGTWESYASGTAFEHRYGISPKDCVVPKIWEDFTGHLAVGITNVIVLWSPDIVVLGGGVAKSSRKFLPFLQQQLEELVVFPQKPSVVIGTLGDEAGLYGGMTLLSS